MLVRWPLLYPLQRLWVEDFLINLEPLQLRRMTARELYDSMGLYGRTKPHQRCCLHGLNLGTVFTKLIRVCSRLRK